MTKTPVYLQSKSHYEILDGLRGVASIMVVIFHVFETYSGNRFKQIINHGYLAVDFFFVLSGFVVAYAYDDRWGKMTQWDFTNDASSACSPWLLWVQLLARCFFIHRVAGSFPLFMIRRFGKC